ncbi:MAG: glycogen debranching enzyme, partial [Treponema sp.]|nr:glycogen debranching enzyme [Treponema sp.]
DGQPDNDFYIAANSDRADVLVTLPTILDETKKWYRVADTSIDDDDAIVPEEQPEPLPSQGHYVIPPNSLIVLMAK